MRTGTLRLILVGTLCAGACGGTVSRAKPADRPAATTAAPAPTTTLAPKAPEAPRTAWQKVTEKIGPDGSVPLSVALQAFALAIGPIPGVDVPEPDAGMGTGVSSGTAALWWIARHDDELSSAQRAAVQSALTATSVSSTCAPSTAPSTTAAEAKLAKPERFAYQPLASGTASARSALFDSEYTCTPQRYIDEDDPGVEDYRFLVDTELGRVEARSVSSSPFRSTCRSATRPKAATRWRGRRRSRATARRSSRRRATSSCCAT